MLRTSLIALTLLAACTPAPSQAPENAETTAEAPAVNPDAAALTATPQTGAWTLRTDEGVTAAGFGPPESEYLLTISCEMPSGKLTLIYEHELVPDQDTTLRIITPVQTLDLAARSFNEGLPSVTAEVANGAAEKAALISMLGAPTDRFAVEVNGESTAFPWADEVSQALIACR
ncbi:MAG: hypothetical protein R3C31_08430 [Hyphomonadaceae bacterium]